MKRRWQVHKFGGTSVGNAERYKNVAGIIRGFDPALPPAIVVSAIKGVTDRLIKIADLARQKNETYLNELAALKTLHLETAAKIVAGKCLSDFNAAVEKDFRDLNEVLRGIRLSGICAERHVEYISGFGEVWSAQILNALLCDTGIDSRWLDARNVLIVTPQEKTVTIDWSKSAENLNQWLKENPSSHLVITGYVASTPDGVATTLKRNGSDYSASIFASLLEAPELFIWTDVDGVYSADPRLVPEAIALDEISYDEAAELAFFGAKVVHPSTMGPAMKKGIPIWIRNTFNPGFLGTKIHKSSKSPLPVKGLSAIDEMALLSIEGPGMAGVPGIAERLFEALSKAGVSVTLISQAGSEHSICTAIPQHQLEIAKAAVKQAFYAELDQGIIDKVGGTADCSILAVVGDGMVYHPGIAGRFFRALGQADVNVKAIAQGSSERNISVVVNKGDGTRALRAVHSAFYLSDQTLSVGIIGAGVVGGALLEQLSRRLDYLKTKRQIDIRIRGLANSKTMILADRHIDLASWRQALGQSSVSTDLEKFVAHVASGEFPHSVIIDATASEEITKNYVNWLGAGLNIITPNKKANTADLADYEKLRQMARQKQKYFVYSTNVGAGLPIVQTLRDLHGTGDQIMEIEGVLSGTLSYIFNKFNAQSAFSAVVNEARAKGYTEPDPRDDLAGMDVARKLVILAREIGLKIELRNVDVESLVPPALARVDAATFMKRLHEFDDEKRFLAEKAAAKNECLRYVGLLTSEGKARVKLKSYPLGHVFSRISGSDNIVAFRTERYKEQPLIIQGPGAGPEVTAAGVFADLLRLAAYVGAPQWPG